MERDRGKCPQQVYYISDGRQTVQHNDATIFTLHQKNCAVLGGDYCTPCEEYLPIYYPEQDDPISNPWR